MSTTIEHGAAGDADARARHFVTFQVQDALFGVPLAEVQEIIRMPELVKVPRSPPGLEGIANLRGSVLPVTSLRQIFGNRHAEHDEATRVLVVNQAGAPVGFVVDRMASVITAEPQEIEDATAIEATVRSDLLRGVVKRQGGMIMLLEPDRLTERQVPSSESRRAAALLASRAETAAARDRTAVVDEIQLVSFEAAGQEYAFPIGQVQEIVQVPDRITQVPQAPPHIVGVMTLRDRLLPLVSLRRMFALPEAPLDEQSRIVVVALGDRAAAAVGIIMDTVKEVLRVNRALVDPVPPLLTASGGAELEAICRLEAGRRLVTILSAEQMFRDPSLGAAAAWVAEADTPQEDTMAGTTAAGSTASGMDEEEQFVVFRLAGEEYGVPINAVQEIVRVPEELTRVPRAADCMEGVINLRGTVLPVIDQRRRFALDGAARNDRQRIMVLTIAGKRTGCIVDSVSEVLKIAHSAIEAAPDLSEAQVQLIRRVANLQRQRRMILLVDPARMLESREAEVQAAA